MVATTGRRLNGDQLAHIAQALRRHHSELRQMCPQRIHQHRALAHQLLAATMQQLRRLLLCRLNRHKSHGRSANRLAKGRRSLFASSGSLNIDVWWKALTPVGRLQAMEQRLDAMLRAVQTVEPALEKFYASLGDEQKERFNRLSPAQG
jgi:LTXXQ motif family protein